jgi:chromosome segregation ATPase
MFSTLISQIEEEATEEATTYNQFACHCKEKTASKSAAIDSESTQIDTRVAELEQKTADKTAGEKRVEKLTKAIEDIKTDLAKEQAKWTEYMAVYTAEHTDMVGACDALKAATELLTEGQKNLSFLQGQGEIQKVLLIADAMGLTVPKKVTAMLQGDDVPDQDYEAHGGGIIETLNKLNTMFLQFKSEMEEEHDKRTSAHNEYVSGLNTELGTSEESIETTKETIADLETDIGIASKDLAEQQAMLFDDQMYLKELTSKCEDKASEWDQRTSAREEELTALNQAKDIISGTVADNEGSVARALIQKPLIQKPSPKRSVAVVGAPATSDVVAVLEEDVASFVQTKKVLLRTGRSAAVDVLMTAAKKLHAPELSALAMQMRADPFAKIKKLIQGLIERLVKEAAEEATQKGFCDTEMGKARHSRDQSVGKVEETSSAIKQGEASRKKLTMKIERLGQEVSDLRDDLKAETNTRQAEKAENEETLASAQEGKVAVKQAIKIMKEHYAGAKTKARVANGGNAVLLQGSPVDRDAGAAGASKGAYGGAQKRAGGIVDMLEVIASDFERAMKQTADAESKAHEDFTEFSKVTKSAIADKETDKKHAERDLEETEAKLASDIEHLQQHQEMLDISLQQLDKLRPACIDTGMTHEERKARREEEIEALQNALSLLAPSPSK